MSPPPSARLAQPAPAAGAGGRPPKQLRHGRAQLRSRGARFGRSPVAAVLAIAAVALLFVTGAEAAEDDDEDIPNFGKDGETVIRVYSEVIQGEVLINMTIGLYDIAPFGRLLKQALTTVAAVSTPVVIEEAHDLLSYEVEQRQLDFTYSVLPHHGAQADVVLKRLATAGSDGTLSELVALMLNSAPDLAYIAEINGADIDTSPPEVTMDEPDAFNMYVDRPSSVVTAKYQSQTQALAEVLLDVFGTTSKCTSVHSPCLCASMASCTWRTTAAGRSYCDFATFVGDISGVPCTRCATQQHCPEDQARLCATYEGPCACALSPGDCSWNSSSSACAPREMNFTSCDECPSQGHCGEPTVLSFSPPSGSVVGLSAGGGARSAHVEVTFDRNIEYTANQGSVAFVCEGPQDTAVRALPSDLLEVEGPVLRIEAALLPNPLRVDCYLRIRSGTLQDDRGRPFAGILNSGTYRFTFEDTFAPEVTALTPAHDEVVDRLPGSLRLHFAETVTATSSFAAEFVQRSALGQWQSLVSFSGPSSVSVVEDLDNSTDRSASVVVFDLGDAEELGFAGSQYSIRIMRGSLVDLAGNAFAGLDPDLYSFRTALSSAEVSVQFSLTIDNIDSAWLLDNDELLAGVDLALRKAIAEVAGEEIGPEHSELEFAASGERSIVVACAVAAPSEEVAADMQVRLGNVTNVRQAVESNLATVPGIEALGSPTFGGITSAKVVTATNAVIAVSGASPGPCLAPSKVATASLALAAASFLAALARSSAPP